MHETHRQFFLKDTSFFKIQCIGKDFFLENFFHFGSLKVALFEKNQTTLAFSGKI